MKNRIASPVLRYAGPSVAVVASYAVFLGLGLDSPHIAHPLLLVVVAASAFASGRRAGTIATATAYLALGVFPVTTRDPTLLADPTHLAFAFAGLFLSVLLGARARIEGERDALDDAVAIERDRLEAILDSSHIGIGFLDAQLRYLQVNEALAEMNGVSVREHLGRRVVDVAPWVPEAVVEVLRNVLRGRAALGLDITVDDARFAAEPRHFLTSFLPLRQPGGAVIGVGFTVSDVTPLKRNEEEQSLLREKAEQAERLADAANRMKDEFLMTLSHEMRSPLQGILGWGRLLREGQLDAKQADHAFETIERIVRQQAELLNGLFDVSRIMAGKMEIERRAVDLAKLVREAFEDKQFSAARHGIVMECDAATPVPVLADPERIHQILSNLLGNAIKFTPTGGRVTLRCSAEDGQGVVHVRDTGEGVPPDFIQHIFERFSQADRSRGRRHPGLGLGLSIVYHLVELHGGSVTAESPGPGGGTTMTVRLPLIAAAALPVPRAPPSVKPGRLPGVRVLLVEDDPSVRDSTRLFLELRAAQVETAASTSAGLAAFHSVKPHVVVTDLGLPGEDGYALLQRLRALPSGREIPVIALSGHASPSERTRCIAAGFALQLVKPVDPELLVRSIAAAVAHDPGIA